VTVEFAPARALLISPHLDDGVFSCGQWLQSAPATCVVTVFAGVPDSSVGTTDWDRQCGFASSAEAMRARHEEDDLALSRLRVESRRLEFLDSQYGRSPEPGAIVDALAAAVRDWTPEALLLPLGLFHSDHDLVHRAALSLRAQQPGLDWIAYEDALYRQMPGLVQRRLGLLAAAGIIATPAVPWRSGEAQAKALAVAAYASQLRAFGDGGYHDVTRPERYWRLGSEAAEGAP
jgi:LmbE family N-acetylglucosaminyl deacetylase